MFKLVVLVVLVAATLAGYGVPAGNPPAAPAYPVLPGYPPAFYPYPRRHHHHHRHSSSDIDSHINSHGQKTRCRSCTKLRASCRDVTNVEHCRKPEISLVRKNGCEHSIISCPPDAEYTLIYNKNASNIILAGKANDVLAKCNKAKNWKVNGSTVNNVACIVPIRKIPIAPCPDDSWVLSAATSPEIPSLCFKALAFENRIATSYLDSKQMCLNLFNATLAPLRNEKERVAFQVAVSRVDNSGWPSSNFTGFYFGMKDISASSFDEAIYQWEINDSLVKPDEFNWDNLQPDRNALINGEYEACGSVIVRNNFTFNDVICKNGLDVIVGAICTKLPNSV